MLNSRKLSWHKLHDYLACEFTGRYVCRSAKMKLKVTTTNGFNDLVGGGGGTLDLPLL